MLRDSKSFIKITLLALPLLLFFEFYNENRRNKEDIWNAAIYGKTQLIKKFLATGIDINTQDEYGATPLHYALQSGHTEISALLITNEAEINIPDNDGLTPLDWAKWLSQKQTADLIRKHGGKTGAELKAEGK